MPDASKPDGGTDNTTDDSSTEEAISRTTCPGGLNAVNFAKEIVLTDVALVNSTRASNWSGEPSETAWWDGSFHFGRLMEDLRGRDGNQRSGDTYQPFDTTSEYIHRWLDEIERDDATNCDVVPGRPKVNAQIRDVWPKVSGEVDSYVTRLGATGAGGTRVTRPRLDVQHPPFRLLAIVFRGDLADLTPPRGHRAANDPERDPAQAGEVRLIYGLFDPATGSAKNFTVAFEYSLPALTPGDVTQWHKRWRQTLAGTLIGSAAWVDGVSRLVWEITRNNGSRNTSNSLWPNNPCLGCGQARPHDNNLHQIRTNDYKTLGATQEFREFRIPLSGGAGPNSGGAPTHFYLNETFSARFLDHPNDKLGKYFDMYCEHIAVEHHKVPQDFPALGGDGDKTNCDKPQVAGSVQAGRITNTMAAGDWWHGAIDQFATCRGLTKNEVRHRFSRNTCNGCHGYEMGFRTDAAPNNFMVRPRPADSASSVSRFLSGSVSVADPQNPSVVRTFNERFRRKNKYRSVLCDGYDQPAYPTTFR